jgi:hypothetical protein
MSEQQKKRKRRTKAEIEADKKAKENQPIVKSTKSVGTPQRYNEPNQSKNKKEFIEVAIAMYDEQGKRITKRWTAKADGFLCNELGRSKLNQNNKIIRHKDVEINFTVLEEF